MSGINLAKQDEAEVQVRDFDMAGQEGELTPENTKRNTWAEMDLNDTLMSNINRLKWTSPTPVQKYAISILGEHGRDILGCAQTGSGKTGAMLIPVINYLMNQGTNFSKILKKPLSTPKTIFLGGDPIESRFLAASMLCMSFIKNLQIEIPRKAT